MKKITLALLIVFLIIVSGIYILGLLYPPHNAVVVNQNEVVNQSNAVESESLTMVNIANHSTQNDCYLVINDNVYDVSNYIGQHPGGRKSITNMCGKEATGIFASIHSNFAWDLLTDYYIGKLVADNNVSNTSRNADVLNKIKHSLSIKYPGAEIIRVKPKSDFYVAKIIYNNSLYEIHVDKTGEILSEEVENDEFDWGSWDMDQDDL